MSSIRCIDMDRFKIINNPLDHQFGGSVLKRVGEAARRQLPEGAFLELRVKVDKDWQRRPDRVERLGY